MSSDTGIALFVYNRAEHTRQVLNGLRRNDVDMLYVFADGPKPDDDLQQIRDTRQVVRSVDWCEIELVERDSNLGLAESVIAGYNYVFSRHDRAIRLENDCVPSPDFVSFMEQCLDKYEDNDRVMNIHGYCPPIDVPEDYPYDVFFTHRQGSWGQATWASAWSLYERDTREYYRIKHSPAARWRLRRAGYDVFPMFKSAVEKDSDSVDIWWTWTILKNGGVSLNPVRSRVRNIGFDGSGTNTSNTDKYDVEIPTTVDEPIVRFPSKVRVDPTLDRRFRTFYGGPLWKNVVVRAIKKLGMWPYVRECNFPV